MRQQHHTVPLAPLRVSSFIRHQGRDGADPGRDRDVTGLQGEAGSPVK